MNKDIIKLELQAFCAAQAEMALEAASWSEEAEGLRKKAKELLGKDLEDPAVQGEVSNLFVHYYNLIMKAQQHTEYTRSTINRYSSMPKDIFKSSPTDETSSHD